jgi:hypothetical protein
MIDTSDYGATLSQDESELVVALADYLGAEKLHLLSNFRSNASAMLPPSGYVATVSRDQPVKADVFRGLHRLFTGIALVEVDTGDCEFNEHARNIWRSHVNLFLPDVSPHPPKLVDSIEAGWIPETGRSGWVGVFTGRVVRPNHTRARSVSTFVVCRAGLPEKTYLELDIILAGQKGVWGEVFGSKMDTVRALAAENRNRILAIAVDALARALGMASPVVYRSKPFPKQESPLDPALQPLARAFLKDDPPVPSWFVIPHVQPRDVAEIPASLKGYRLGAALGEAAVCYPGVLPGVMDIPCDDVVQTATETMTIFVAACSVRSKIGMPVTNGPTGDMIIYNYKAVIPWPLHSLGAVPFEACFQHGAMQAVKSSNTTWADATVEQNRNVTCEWVYVQPSETGDPAPMSRYGAPMESGDQLELDRVKGWMRVSVLDPLGGFNDKKSFAGLRAVSYPGILL